VPPEQQRKRTEDDDSMTAFTSFSILPLPHFVIASLLPSVIRSSAALRCLKTSV
jgi:hypothetical protein